MTTLYMTIYQTADLEEYLIDTYGSLENDRAAKRAKTWIKGAFSHTSDYDIDITIVGKNPNPPQEGPAGDSFTASDVCGSGDRTYSNLWRWWRDWMNSDCTDSIKKRDINLLLTNYTGTGLGGGAISLACVGQDIAELSSTYSDFGYYDRHNAMDTVLEEMGHCFINKDNCIYSDSDGDGTGHDWGEVLYDSANEDYGITPMGLAGDTCHNNCADSGADTNYCRGKAEDDSDADDDVDGWAFQYSACALCAFR